MKLLNDRKHLNGVEIKFLSTISLKKKYFNPLLNISKQAFGFTTVYPKVIYLIIKLFVILIFDKKLTVNYFFVKNII